MICCQPTSASSGFKGLEKVVRTGNARRQAKPLANNLIHWIIDERNIQARAAAAPCKHAAGIFITKRVAHNYNWAAADRGSYIVPISSVLAHKRGVLLRYNQLRGEPNPAVHLEDSHLRP